MKKNKKELCHQHMKSQVFILEYTDQADYLNGFWFFGCTNLI